MTDKSARELLKSLLPPAAEAQVFVLIEGHPCTLKLVNQRKTKHGDFRRKADGSLTITLNKDKNPYRFLLTLVHEYAHLVTYKSHGHVQAHGKEWKSCFQRLMLPFLNDQIWPKELLKALAKHLKKPMASSERDAELALALAQYDPWQAEQMVLELEAESLFEYKNKIFRKGPKRRVRFLCTELESNKQYTFPPNVRVKALDQSA